MIQQAVAPPDVPGNVPGLPAGLTARPFAYPSDLPAMSELVAAANAFDGHDHFPTPEVLGVEWRPTELFDPGRDCLVIEDGSGWAAMVSVDPQVRDGKVVHWTEGWVRPDRRHQGIGRALLSWAERHAADLVRCRAIESADLPQFVGFGVLESNPDAVRFAAASGYSRVRFGFLMRRDLSEPIPEAALPPGIELRPVKPEQHRQIWDADVEAFRDHFEPRERNADEMEATFTAPHMDTALWRVAWEGSEVVGSVMNLIDPDENARIGLDIGWLEHVSVRRAWRGRGVASALIVESMRALRDRGMAIAQLGVDGENPTGAVAIYERLGFTRHETWIAHRRPLDPGTVDERSRWKATVDVRPFEAGRDFAPVVDLIGDVNAHDGLDWFPTVASLANDWSAGSGYDPARDTVVVEADGRLAGAARHSWREREGAIVHRLQVWVRPSERRRGLGRRLLAWAEDRARKTVAAGEAGPTTLAHVFGGGAGKEVEASAGFAAAMGYAPVRYHFEMRRSLDEPIRDATLPDGLEVRPVRPDHHRAIWEADGEAFQDHWDHETVTEDDFLRFFAEPDIDTSLWQVAWDGDEVAGLVINAIYTHENERTGKKVGWLESVATRRQWRRRGVAAALIARSLAVLRERGMEEAALGVDAESPTGALGLYESFGFRAKRTWMFLQKPF